MEKFSIDSLYTLIKHSVDGADLESLLTSAPADDYAFESREIAEHLAESDNATTVADLTTWLKDYWSRQFGATPTEEWLASRDFRTLAGGLIGQRKTVDTPEAHLRYQSWLCSPAVGYDLTNGALLELARNCTVELAQELYGGWATGVQNDVTETERRLRQIADFAGYGETRRVMVQELFTLCVKVDARGFLACVRGESKEAGFDKAAEELKSDTLQMQLRDCISLYVESVLTQPAPQSGCDSGNPHSAAGDSSVN